ncbi:hypothetical protein [Fodinicola feengrottensis]|uniref:Energy transducer TonB n=1 Tax=Fodinicola feengrottensis TaxID=435914 RepID=A0ABN2FQZ5_9ACTN|nr:hypothetical protein [Fodinicola feengrottensis]
MRRLVRGLALVSMVAGVGYAVFTLTRLAKDISSDQFDDYTPPAKTPTPTPKQDEEPESGEKPAAPGKIKPQSNQWQAVPSITKK